MSEYDEGYDQGYYDGKESKEAELTRLRELIDNLYDIQDKLTAELEPETRDEG